MNKSQVICCLIFNSYFIDKKVLGVIIVLSVSQKKKGVKKMKIITHLEPRHFDETLAIACICHKEGKPLPVVLVSPQSEEIPQYVDGVNYIVDVGRKFNPIDRCFDHHQNIDLPCSLKMVLEYLGYQELIYHPLTEYIDILDKFGLKAVLDRGYKVEPIIADRGKLILHHVNFAENADIIFDNFKRSLTYTDFVNNIYGIFKEELKEIEEKVKEERQKKIEFFTKNLTVEEYSGITYIYYPDFITPFEGEIFKRFNPDLIIQKIK